ncbi:MAG: lytic transglycosylase domain-containing protein [Opitutaceae bacterium]
MSDLSLVQKRGPFRRHFCVALLASCSWLGVGSKAHAEESANPEWDRDVFLRAISEVETGGNSRAVGQAGERGMYQFRRQTWQQHTSRSFFEAHNPVVARSVAALHYDWLLAGFRRNGRAPSVHLMAAAWNSGLSRTLNGRVSKASRDYARRVANLVTATVPPTNPVNPRRLFIASSGE